MKKNILLALTMLFALSVNAQDINLPAPDKQQQSQSMVETLNARHSVRAYEDTELSLQEISNLCWAACGQARDDKHITSPTAMNRQEIRLFVFTKQGVYEYDNKANMLVSKVAGDHRNLLCGGGGFSQDFIMEAPVSLLMVVDFDIFRGYDERSRLMGYIDAGIVCENINLYCQAVGLATVPRATMDTKAISSLLGFTEKQQPVMNNPVGYEKGVDKFVSENGTSVVMHCIKHGTLSMQIGDKWLYVDPVTDKVQPVTDYSSMPKADYILVTHEHADHLDAKAIEQLSKSSTVLITNPRSSELLGGKGKVMRNGDSSTLGSWKIEAVPAYNTSKDKQQFHPKGRDNGYVLTIDGLRIYIAGDTEDIAEMKNLGSIDVALLPCNLPFTMSPEQLVSAAKVVKPKVLFPYHYGQTDIQQVVKLLKDSGIDVRIRQYQ